MEGDLVLGLRVGNSFAAEQRPNLPKRRAGPPAALASSPGASRLHLAVASRSLLLPAAHPPLALPPGCGPDCQV